MDYVIIVNDNGELKTISATELEKWSATIDANLNRVINRILDEHKAEEKAMLLGPEPEQPLGYDEANETVDAKMRS